MFPIMKWLYPREWFDDAEWVKFEDMEVPIPVGAKEYLAKRYGDYMKLPPEEKRKPHHYTEIVDLDKSYKNYSEGML